MEQNDDDLIEPAQEIGSELANVEPKNIRMVNFEIDREMYGRGHDVDVGIREYISSVVFTDQNGTTWHIEKRR